MSEYVVFTDTTRPSHPTMAEAVEEAERLVTKDRGIWLVAEVVASVFTTTQVNYLRGPVE